MSSWNILLLDRSWYVSGRFMVRLAALERAPGLAGDLAVPRTTAHLRTSLPSSVEVQELLCLPCGVEQGALVDLQRGIGSADARSMHQHAVAAPCVRRLRLKVEAMDRRWHVEEFGEIMIVGNQRG